MDEHLHAGHLPAGRHVAEAARDAGQDARHDGCCCCASHLGPFARHLARAQEEEEARLAAKKKAEDMENELRSWINLVHGPNAWSDLLKMQAKIRKQRQEQLYAQAELRQKIFNIVGIVLLCTIIGGVVMWIGYLFYFA